LWRSGSHAPRDEKGLIQEIKNKESQMDVLDDSGLYQEGRIQMESGAFEQAIETFQKSAHLFPHFKTLELLGECLLQTGRATEAVVPLAASAYLNRQVRAGSLLAQAFLKLDDYKAAAEVASRVLATEPKNRIALEVARLCQSKENGTA
jgi:tetratricopeptide (TPR) repeat protein